MRREGVRDADQVPTLLAEEVERILREVAAPPAMPDGRQEPLVIMVVGVNGSGKTTALRILHRELVPDSGRVLLEGHDLAGLSGRERARRIAVMSQDGTGELPMTAADAVMLGRMLGYAWGGRLGRGCAMTATTARR